MVVSLLGPEELAEALRDLGVPVEKCPDGDGRWHIPDYCVDLAGLREAAVNAEESRRTRTRRRRTRHHTGQPMVGGLPK